MVHMYPKPAKQTRNLKKAMAFLKPKLRPGSTVTTPGKKFQFLDEEERRRDPVSYLHSVRSNARKNPVLEQCHTRRSEVRNGKLRKLAKVSDSTSGKGSDWEVLGAASFSAYSGNLTTEDQSSESIGRKVAACQSRPLSITHPCSQHISPWAAFGQGTADPFNSYPIEMQPYTYAVLDHYITLSQWTGPGLGVYASRWMPLLISSKMAFQALLAVAELRFRTYKGLEPWSVLAVNWLSSSLGLLRKEIDSTHLEVSDAMLVTVISLVGIEASITFFYSANYARERVNGVSDPSTYLTQLGWGTFERYLNHRDGLNRMVKLRGGLHKIGWIKSIVLRVNSVAIPTTLAGSGSKKSSRAIQAEHSISENTDACNTVSRVSQELVKIIKCIRRLASRTGTPDILGADLHAECVELQQVLKTIESRTDVGSLNDACILASSIYIDIVLLQTAPNRVFLSEANGRLQQTILQLRAPREKTESQEVVVWISATADAAIGWSNGHDLQIALIDKFNLMVTRLEGLSVQ